MVHYFEESILSRNDFRKIAISILYRKIDNQLSFWVIKKVLTRNQQEMQLQIKLQSKTVDSKIDLKCQYQIYATFSLYEKFKRVCIGKFIFANFGVFSYYDICYLMEILEYLISKFPLNKTEILSFHSVCLAIFETDIHQFMYQKC